MSNIIDSIQLSGVTYGIQGSGGTQTIELTQAEYDALVDKDPNTFYVITDAQAGDLTQYWTSAQTQSAITQATSGLQETLVSGTNIKTINNTSLLGSGNIDIQGGGGGGKAIEAGTNISVTTGETADTINCTLPISVDTRQNGTNLILFNYSNTINHNQTKGNFIVGVNNIFGNMYDQAEKNFVFGNTNTLEGYWASNRCLNNFVVGNGNFFGSMSAKYAVSNAAVFGDYNKPKNNYEYVFGQYNNSVSASATFGDSGNTLFSVGNGTGDNARHNAFEIRQNGDIYLSSGGTDIKLQDTITATAANTTALGGLKLVKLSQSEYDALATKDNSTLYVIVN